MIAILRASLATVSAYLRPAGAVTVSLPACSPPLVLARRVRMWLAAFLAFAVLVSLALYVAAVNVILLDGADIRASQEARDRLVRDRARLEEMHLERSSPARLTARSQEIGMIELGQVRYLTTEEPLARSR